jgi:hypothetical protein
MYIITVAIATLAIALAALARKPAAALESDRQEKLVSCIAERGGWAGIYAHKGRAYRRPFSRQRPQTLLADDLGAW